MSGQVPAISQQAVGRLPWGHNLLLFHTLKHADERLAYAESALEHGRSRAGLEMHIGARSEPLATNPPTIDQIEREVGDAGE